MKTQWRAGAAGDDSPNMASGAPTAVLNTMKFMADPRHMHGATDEGPICHIALRAADGPTDWVPQNVPEDWRQYL